MTATDEDPSGEIPGIRRPVRRRRILVVAASGVVLLLAGLTGWYLARAFVSPEQQAALASPPPPGVVTAEVVVGDLVDTISVNVQIDREGLQAVPILPGSGLTVVTRQPLAAGDPVDAGSAVLEVNGRPAIAVPGDFPFYRDLTVGDRGPDVTQLQHALNAAGHKVAIDGRFGGGTASAVRAMYRDAGYDVATTEIEGPEGELTATILMPATELVVIKALPAFLVSSPAVSESIGEESQFEFEQGALVGVGSVPSGFAARLEKGMRGELETNSGIIKVEILELGDPDEESGEARLVLTPVDAELALELLREEVLAVITLQLSAENVLIVPSRAVAPGGDGFPSVLKQEADGVFVIVRVREISRLNGQSAVEPVTEGELVEGDNIQVG